MKAVVYTDVINKNERDAKVKGCKFKLKVLHVEKNIWLTLYYRNEENATKEHARMERLGHEHFRHLSEVVPI
jgi:hypothetical protein